MRPVYEAWPPSRASSFAETTRELDWIAARAEQAGGDHARWVQTGGEYLKFLEKLIKRLFAVCFDCFHILYLQLLLSLQQNCL